MLRATLQVPHNPRAMALALEGCIAQSRAQIRRGEVGRLYSSHVRYQREPSGREEWRTARQTYEAGEGDCEDLVIWRVAELREDGDARARPVVLPLRPRLWHVVVERGDGWLEDPSVYLGMTQQAAVAAGRHPLMETNELGAADAPTSGELGAVDQTTGEALPDSAHDAAELPLPGPDYEQAQRDAVLEHAAAESRAAAAAALPWSPLDPYELRDLADADADAYAAEQAPVAIEPSVRWATTPRQDGTHDARILVSLRDGRELRVSVHARSRKAALLRAVQRVQRAAKSPIVQALLPPKAKAAIKGVQVLAGLARNGQVASVLRQIRTRGLKAIAQALSL